MKIALMSGAYKNAGDFLIEKRSREILQFCYPEAEIDIFKRNISYDDKIDELNSYNAIVFGGGPGFQKDIYPSKTPFVRNLEDIKTHCAVLGWGWKGKNIDNSTVYKKKYFTPAMLNFISFLNKEGNSMSCRDWYTVQMLKNQGFKDVTMTGCPAWYEVEMVKDLKYKGCTLGNSDTPYIIVSDAAFPKNNKYTGKLIEIIREKFSKARIKLLLHRGITEENKYLTEPRIAQRLNYEFEDISGSVVGFAQYDECDLHIGFRVHAHIYNLSHGNTTILVNEDARGFGVNGIMGIPNISIDKYLKKNINIQIDNVIDSKGIMYCASSEVIKNQFDRMQEFVKEIV